MNIFISRTYRDFNGENDIISSTNSSFTCGFSVAKNGGTDKPPFKILDRPPETKRCTRNALV